MAFSYSIDKTSVFGNVRVVIGSFTNGASDTGGNIATGLNQVFYFNSDTETVATAPNKHAISGGTVTITTTANEDGKFIAIGV